jgi:hypothetical protein
MGLDKSSFKKAFPKQYAEKKKLDAAWEAHEGGGNGVTPTAPPPTVPETQALRGSLLESRRRAAQANQSRFMMKYVKENF